MKTMNQFLEDVVTGLTASPKYLQSKYFYDAAGDALFQQIMTCQEYYLTNCEKEIFATESAAMARLIMHHHPQFDVVELGPGDAVKSIYLLRELVKNNAIGTYFPVDISPNIINYLHHSLPAELPQMPIHGLNGEYLPMLQSAKNISDKIKLVLFLGSNIGNVPREDVSRFCRSLRNQLSAGDIVLMGLDLKKHPKQILAAYNDSRGYTREFNLNLLRRINRELSGNFDPNAFEHYATYDPATGTCKSYLISQVDQLVTIPDGAEIKFAKNEAVFMEVSQKYTIEESDAIATGSGFEPVAHYYDRNRWFADVVWKCV